MADLINLEKLQENKSFKRLGGRIFSCDDKYYAECLKCSICFKIAKSSINFNDRLATFTCPNCEIKSQVRLK
jgi:hypothetical protein